MARHPFKIRTHWFRRVGHMAVLKGKKPGEVAHFFSKGGWPWREADKVSDTEVMNAFVWMGRYLAEKGKLPRHLALEEIAVGAQRTTRAIREVVANEIYQIEILRNNQDQL